ncbi:MAG: alpha/beta hydrolase [Oscillospiraceae bacterium]
MTDFQEFTFLSSDGHTQLHGAQWTPADREPIAVLQIAHGVAEHILRYDDFARYLNDRGILVAGHDHLGHGKSLPEGGTCRYISATEPPGRRWWTTSTCSMTGCGSSIRICPSC